MNDNFLNSVLGHTGIPVFRLGLSASYFPGVTTVHRALDEGINLFFAFGIDTQMIRGLRDTLKARRASVVLATGAYNLIWGYPDLRKTLEKRLRQFGTDYIDIFLFLGIMKPEQFPDRALEEMVRFREEGTVRAIGVSTHNREYAGSLARNNALDVLMVRYNAAHRGAEQDIFPYLTTHDPGVISYTATRWTQLFRRHRSWPPDRPIPSPGMAYRFVLSNPNVDVCITAPTNLKQLEDNLNAVRQGPLSADEIAFMREYGDTVHHTKKWFMGN